MKAPESGPAPSPTSSSVSRLAEGMVIHQAVHTVGLGKSFPAAGAITPGVHVRVSYRKPSATTMSVRQRA